MRILTALLAIAFVACNSPKPLAQVAESVLLEITAVDTVISTESGLLGYVADMVVDSAGELYVGDSETEQILRVNPESGSIRRLGGAGQGPSEFKNLGAL